MTARSVEHRKAAQSKRADWDSIRSDDLGIYVRNLRASGCPEPVTQSIIVEELHRMFAARWNARPIDTNFWRTGPQRDAARAEKNRAKREFELERRAIIKDLLGIEWNEAAVNDSDPQHGAYVDFLYGGTLSHEKWVTLKSLWSKFSNIAQALHSETDLKTPEWEAALRQVGEQMMDALRRILTPGELEELDLRTMSVDVGDVWGSERLFGCVMTGQELRELLRIKKGAETPLTKFILRGDLDLPKPSSEAIEQQDKQIRALLGEERFQGYLRAKDFEFRWVHGGPRERPTPMEVTWAIYDAYRSARDAAKQVRMDLTLTEEQRKAALMNLRNQAAADIRVAVESEQIQSTLEKARGLLDQALAEKRH
ncbi:MAG: hypothetical protein L0Z50_35580 [Verrucomicrobiales bacterium]|nr:hypothetical protein [Verrucomicrobiales bacterium]